MAQKIEVESMSDELAESIRRIGAATRAMKASGLKQSAIVVLIKDQLGVTFRKDVIVQVLNALDRLESTYLEPRK